MEAMTCVPAFGKPLGFNTRANLQLPCTQGHHTMFMCRLNQSGKDEGVQGPSLIKPNKANPLVEQTQQRALAQEFIAKPAVVRLKVGTKGARAAEMNGRFPFECHAKQRLHGVVTFVQALEQLVAETCQQWLHDVQLLHQEPTRAG